MPPNSGPSRTFGDLTTFASQDSPLGESSVPDRLTLPVSVIENLVCRPFDYPRQPSCRSCFSFVPVQTRGVPARLFPSTIKDPIVQTTSTSSQSKIVSAERRLKGTQATLDSYHTTTSSPASGAERSGRELPFNQTELRSLPNPARIV